MKEDTVSESEGGLDSNIRRNADASAALMSEVVVLLEQARRERDCARNEAEALREALRLSRVTPASLLGGIDLYGLDDNARLLVMAQNPADNHYWSRKVGAFTVGEVRSARVSAQ